MQQRLGLARVLIHDPKVLLLDEPASGLDPRARIEMMAILQELQRLGKTIIISSHILSELQTLCNRVAIIEKGKLIYSGPVQGVRDQMSAGLIYWVLPDGDPAAGHRPVEGPSRSVRSRGGGWPGQSDLRQPRRGPVVSAGGAGARRRQIHAVCGRTNWAWKKCSCASPAAKRNKRSGSRARTPCAPRRAAECPPYHPRWRH